MQTNFQELEEMKKIFEESLKTFESFMIVNEFMNYLSILHWVKNNNIYRLNAELVNWQTKSESKYRLEVIETVTLQIEACKEGIRRIDTLLSGETLQGGIN